MNLPQKYLEGDIIHVACRRTQAVAQYAMLLVRHMLDRTGMPIFDIFGRTRESADESADS